MPENRGSALAATTARGHRPLPRASDAGYRAPHQQPPKPTSTFDWDWNKDTCTRCTAKVPKSHLVDGLCRTCRGDIPANNIPADVAPRAPKTTRRTATSKTGQTFQPFDEADIEARYKAPSSTPAEPEPAPEPAPPAQVEPEPAAPVAQSGPSSEVEDRQPPVPRATYADALQDQLDHTLEVLTRAHGNTDPIVGMLRSSVYTSVAALDLYLERHHRTPATSTSPRTSRAPTTQPGSKGLGGDQPAAGPQGEGGQQPARTHRRGGGRVRRNVDETAIAREYVEDRESIPTIARRHHVGNLRVREILSDAAIPLRDDRGRRGGRNKITHSPETIADLVRRYVDDHSPIRDIETATGIDRRQITRILTEASVTIRPAASQAHHQLTAEQQAQAIDDYLSGTSLIKIANQMHVGQPTIRAVIAAAGHPIRVKGNSAANALRLRDLGITAAHLKDWSLAIGLVDIRPTGLPGRALIDAYQAAHPSTQPGTEPEQSGDTAT